MATPDHIPIPSGVRENDCYFIVAKVALRLLLHQGNVGDAAGKSLIRRKFSVGRERRRVNLVLIVRVQIASLIGRKLYRELHNNIERFLV